MTKRRTSMLKTQDKKTFVEENSRVNSPKLTQNPAASSVTL